MRRELFDCGDLGILTHHPPHDFLANARTPNGTGMGYAAKDETIFYTSSGQPRIHRGLDPVRHWDCTHAATLAIQIDNGPMIVPFAEDRSTSRRLARNVSARNPRATRGLHG